LIIVDVRRQAASPTGPPIAIEEGGVEPLHVAEQVARRSARPLLRHQHGQVYCAYMQANSPSIAAV